MWATLTGHLRSRLIKRAGGVALVATVMAVFAAPAPSMAAEPDFYWKCHRYTDTACQNGIETTGPTDDCGYAGSRGHNTTVCIAYSGDYVYVKDGVSDGHSAIGQIWENGDGTVVAERICRNPNGYGSWARCNFNWSESVEKRVYGGYLVGRDDIYRTELWSFRGK